MKQNYADICNSILALCDLTKHPLSDDQRMVLSGAISIWLDKQRADALEEAATICAGLAGCSYEDRAPTLRDAAQVIRARKP